MESSSLEKFLQKSTSHIHPNQIQIGKKLVDLMLFSLAIKHTKIQKYIQIKGNFSQYIKEILSFPRTSDHIYKCFGNAYQLKDFKTIQKVEKDIEKYLIGSTHSQFQSSINIDKPSTSTISIASGDLKISKIKSLSKQNEEDWEDYKAQKDSDTIDFSSFLNDLSISGIVDNTRFRIKNYLQSEVISFNAQLNFACQQVKFQLGEWKRTKTDDIFTQRNVLKGQNIYTEQKLVKFQGSGQDKNSKNAKEKASSMILMKMYSELPLVFDHVKKVKKQKSIKH